MIPNIVGIDPGLASLGWAVAELLPAGPRLLSLGCLRTAPGKAALLKSEDNLARLRVLWRGLQTLADLKPVAIAIESQSWPRNASSAAKMAMPWGLICAMAEQLACPVIHISPQALKMAVTGKRDASKDEVEQALNGRAGFETLQNLLGRSGLPRGQWEHPVDAAGAIVAALDTEIGRAVGRTAELK